MNVDDRGQEGTHHDAHRIHRSHSQASMNHFQWNSLETKLDKKKRTKQISITEKQLHQNVAKNMRKSGVQKLICVISPGFVSQSRRKNQLRVDHAVFELAQLLKILDILVVGNKDGYLERVAILLIQIMCEKIR